MTTQTVHASAVVIGGTGILILGPSGAGKSSLALDLIDQCMLRKIPAALIGDDRLVLSQKDGQPMASPAATIAGLIEVRGSGIHHISHLDEARIDLAVRLLGEKQAVRMPDTQPVEVLEGFKLPVLDLPQGHAAVRAVLAHLGHYGGVKSLLK